LKIFFAKALIWAALSLAVWCGGAAPALAQTYDFDFTASGFSGLSVVTLDSNNT
jgi:hypothetical protein